MSKLLAHDLNDNKWRSQDISVAEEDSEVTFASLGLKTSVLSGLKANGFIRLSAIQLHAIPIGRCGLDLIVQSKSGTGKTCVFVVTALEVIEPFDSVQVLIVCPTREIAVQTNHVMAALGAHVPDFRSCPVIGGTKVKEDLNLLSKCQAVVGTPGRIKQLIELNALKTQSIRLLVLDECDKLMDNNFKRQIDDIFECLPQNKQLIAVSATMSTDLANFLRQYMRTPVFVRLNADNPALIGVKQFYRITPYHHLNHINFDHKIEPLIDLLKSISFSQCLVFSNYQTRARMLCDTLNGLNWKSEYISAEKAQSERLKAISKLKKYKCRILVSTDLTARGIDVQNVNLVVNMDTPFDTQTYLHRIGRAGRFGTKGIAITLASSGREEEQLHKIIKDCKLNVTELKGAIPRDIWKMDDIDEEFCQDNEPSMDSSDLPYEHNYHPFDAQSEKPDSTDSSDQLTNGFTSFDDILKKYNILKNSVQSEPEKTNISNDVPNVSGSLDQELVRSIKKCYIEEEEEKNIDFVDYASGDRKAAKGITDSKSTDTFISETNIEKNCPKSEENYRYLSEEECEQNSNESEHKIESSGRLSSAVFPPIQSVSNPIEYNQWMRRNLHLWLHLSNPFENS